MSADARTALTDPPGGASVRPPPPAFLLLESLSMWEWATLPYGSSLLALTSHGDGHPVLVLPGFGGSDHSTMPMRALLRAKGYAVHGWELGSNVGPHPHIVRGLERKLLELHERYDGRVSIVGWSLGGMMARELARAHPEAVRSVITLASPFRFQPGDRGFASPVYDRIGPRDHPFAGWSRPENERIELTVPSTSIYTKTDGIVRWHTCIDEEGPRRENIGVYATHSGLGCNTPALFAVSDRLAQPEDRWRPFRAPLPLRGLYRRRTWWRPATQTAETA